MDKHSSDELASMASQIMRHGNPIKDTALIDQIIHNVRDAIATGTQADARNAVIEPLQQFCNAAISMAGSVVSQADGPEKAQG